MDDLFSRAIQCRKENHELTYSNDEYRPLWCSVCQLAMSNEFGKFDRDDVAVNPQVVPAKLPIRIVTLEHKVKRG